MITPQKSSKNELLRHTANTRDLKYAIVLVPYYVNDLPFLRGSRTTRLTNPHIDRCLPYPAIVFARSLYITV